MEFAFCVVLAEKTHFNFAIYPYRRTQKKETVFNYLFLTCNRRRPTLPGRVQPSTISAEGLNFCVRNENRWIPFAFVTGMAECPSRTLTTAQ